MLSHSNFRCVYFSTSENLLRIGHITQRLIYVVVGHRLKSEYCFFALFCVFVDTAMTCIIFLLTAIQQMYKCDASNEWNWPELYTPNKQTKTAAHHIILDMAFGIEILKLIIEFRIYRILCTLSVSLSYALFQISTIYLQTMVNLCLKIW